MIETPVWRRGRDMQQGPITVEDVRRRAAAAGVTIDEDVIADVAALVEAAVAPLRALDRRALRLTEPASTYHAAVRADA